MYSWIKSEILELPATDYLVLYGVLVVGFCYLLYYCYGAFKRFRFIDGTATSKIRSAAQGHVENLRLRHDLYRAVGSSL